MGKNFFIGYTIFLTLFIALIIFTPVLAFSNLPLAQKIYDPGLVWACHQKISRSLCLFQGDSGYFISDCTKQTGAYIENDNKILSTTNEHGQLGYKMPVCSRDIGIYLAMLIGGLAFPLFRKINSKDVPPAIYLVLAVIPLGIDGTLQLLSNIGLTIPVLGSYESTNLIRLITGFIAGLVLPFYIFPMVSVYFGKKNSKDDKNDK